MSYQRKEFKWFKRGVQLAKPADLLGDDECPRLLNFRATQQGTLTARPGMSAVNATAIDPIHSVVRLNNSLPSASQTYARFVGSGTLLFSDNSAHTAFTQRATGFSGNPLQFVTIRPQESPEPWLYVSDSSKSGKANVSGTFRNHGIAPPVVAPYAQPAATSKQVISDFEAVGAWANGGTAGAISTATRISTTITKIVYDAAAPNWATVQPAVLDESIQPGMLLVVNSGGGTAETVLVESVSEAVTTTTISSIQYDTGTSGPCTIQLTAPTDMLARDSMLQINAGGAGDEVVRVLSVIPGPGGIPSFRCSTVNTHVATDTITGLRSFRAYFANTHAAGETLASTNLQSTIAVGTGYITLAGALDLSVVNSRPVTPEDEIHISIKIDNIDRLTEGRIAFDIDRNTNDFTQNYLYKPFRTNDLSPATTGSITTLAAQQRVIQRDQIDETGAGATSTPDTTAPEDAIQIANFGDKLIGYYDPPDLEEYYKSHRIMWIDEFGNETFYPPPAGGNPPTLVAQTTLGTSQWTELRFKVKDLIRVGSDTARGLHDVAAIRIQLQVTDTVVMDVDAWWIGGTYGAQVGPDIGVGAPYNYRYVYRSQATGAQSNPSPPMRQGINVKRQSISGTVTASSDPQVDQIDIYRTGGALITSDGSPPWFYVMTVPNSSPAFTDVFPDDIVIRTRQISFDHFQPFLDLDIPRSGVCSVKGTEVTRVSGDNFNTAWPAGTIITINNVPYTLYVQPSSTSSLSLAENAGTQTSVNWFITTPRLMAQPMPALWGPFGGGTFEPVMFACGSRYQPGKVFWTTSGTPDASSAYDCQELTTPSEPLMNGCVFRSQAYVFSSESLYVLQPTIVGSQLRFSGAKVAGNRGLFSRYALCVGDEGIFYLSRDGIYLTTGADSVSLTDEMLYPLFPHEGQTGTATNGFNPPDFTLPQYLRLSYGESMVYFDYKDTSGTFCTIVYDLKVKGWFPYSYGADVRCHYVEEGASLNSMLLGGNDGVLYLSGGITDAGTEISLEAQTNWFDNGDPRASKQWANGMLDYSGMPTVGVVAENGTDTLDVLPLITRATRGQSILDFDQEIHRNLQLQVSGVAPMTLYGYSMDWTQVSVSEQTEQRNAYATELLYQEYGIAHYIYLAHISTSDLTLTITVDNQAADTYTIVNGGGILAKTWVMLRARKGLLWNVSLTSAAEFQVIPSQSLMRTKPWKSQGAFADANIFGDKTFQ